MQNNRTNPEDKNQVGQQQPAQHEKEHMNPFRDADDTGSEPTVEEETELEQQRKEAMTERD